MREKTARNSHHRPVLHPWIMCQAKDVPNDNVLLQYVIVPGCRIMDTVLFKRRLQSISATSVQLIVFVLGDPHMMLSEQGTLGLDAIRIRQQLLRWRWHNLISHWLSTDRILFIQILDLETSIILRCGIQSYGCGDWSIPDFVEVTVGVGTSIYSQR